jgi:carboxylate-amine ligase
VTSRWPTVGPSPDLDSAEQYDRLVTDLVDSGVISDAGMVYFDARLSARYPTIEIRVADSCPVIDDVVLVAAIGRALVDTAVVEDDAHATVPESPQVLLRAATWRAARSGLSGLLIDPITRRAVPAADQVRALLDHVRPALEARGDWDTAAELATELQARRTSAERQRAMLAKGADHRALVAALTADTARS